MILLSYLNISWSKGRGSKLQDCLWERVGMAVSRNLCQSVTTQHKNLQGMALAKGGSLCACNNRGLPFLMCFWGHWDLSLWPAAFPAVQHRAAWERKSMMAARKLWAKGAEWWLIHRHLFDIKWWSPSIKGQTKKLIEKGLSWPDVLLSKLEGVNSCQPTMSDHVTGRRGVSSRTNGPWSCWEEVGFLPEAEECNMHHHHLALDELASVQTRCLFSILIDISCGFVAAC